jgi:flagellar secretion chaperone FliS
MRRNQTELSYRRAAVQNASAVGLVIIMYDMLIEDVREVIEALKQGDIEKRATALKHGFLVLGQMEGSLDMEKGGTAAVNLAQFYSVLRANLLDAHIKSSAEKFQRQIELMLEVRQAWEQVNKPDAAATTAVEAAENPDSRAASASAGGWSA